MMDGESVGTARGEEHQEVDEAPAVGGLQGVYQTFLMFVATRAGYLSTTFLVGAGIER